MIEIYENPSIEEDIPPKELKDKFKLLKIKIYDILLPFNKKIPLKLETSDNIVQTSKTLQQS